MTLNRFLGYRIRDGCVTPRTAATQPGLNYQKNHEQDEYGVVSFAETKLASVVRYIHNQKGRQAERTLIAAMQRKQELSVNIVANNSKPKLPIQVIFAMILAIAVLCTSIIAIGPMVLPMILKPTPTAIQVPTSTPSILPKQPLAETPAGLTDTPNPTGTSTIMSTDTPSASFTPTYTTQQLPDLTVSAISNPICARDHLLTTAREYVKLSVILRNVGRVSTRSFGPFSVLVNLILGQTRYSLDEWASSFNGVIDSSDMDIPNLNPDADIRLNLAIDLKGNTNFAVEAIANSGSNAILESDTTNNTLIQGFSVICT